MSEELLTVLKQKKADLSLKREIEDKRTALSEEIKDKRLENQKDAIDKQISHRELFDNELRAAITLAAEKRVEASYRDLIDASDKMKKQINVIDGVGTDNAPRAIFILPSELYHRDAPPEVILKDNIIEGALSSPLPQTQTDEAQTTTNKPKQVHIPKTRGRRKKIAD